MLSSSLVKNYEARKRKYPYLGINGDLVVLFTGESEGMILHTDKERVEIGTVSKTWNEDAFKICNHTIHLKMCDD